MTIAFDKATQSAEWTGTTPASTTHSPVGTPRGVAIFCLGSGSTTSDVYTGATYGSLSLTRVPGLYAIDTATEQGLATVYFAGSGIPTGDQTFTVTQSGGSGETRRLYCVTWTAATDTEVVDSDQLANDATNPALTLDSGARTASIAMALFSGRPTGNIAVTAGLTSDFETAVAADARSFNLGHETTPSTGSRSLGWTASADDCALVGIAVAEVLPPAKTGTVTATGGGVAAAASTTTRSRAIVEAGGGVATLAPTGAHKATTVATGAGVATEAATTARAGTVSATGGGSATITAGRGTGAAIGALTGGGVAHVAHATDRPSTVAATGAGVVTIAAVGPLEEHEGTVEVTGGGSVAIAARRSARTTLARTGGGIVTLSPRHEGALRLGLTGSGSVGITWTGTHGGTVTATGGGRVRGIGSPFDWGRQTGTISAKPVLIGTVSGTATVGVASPESASVGTISGDAPVGVIDPDDELIGVLS